MKLIKQVSILLVMVSAISGCSIFSGDDNIVEVAALPQFENQFTPKEVWSGRGGEVGKYYSQLSPAALASTLYVADREGLVKAMQAGNGKIIWQTDLSDSEFLHKQNALLSGGVTVDEQQVYVASEKAMVYALDRQTGKLRWKVAAKGEVLANPVVSNGIVLIHTGNGFLQALKSDTGEQIWVANLSVPTLSVRGQSTPAVAHGGVIVGDDNGKVNAMFLHNGQLIWQQRIAKAAGASEIARLNDIDGSPLIYNNVVYISGYNGYLVALSLQSGQLIWKHDLSSVHSLAISGDRLYAVDQNDNIEAVSIESGAVLWKQNLLQHRQLSDPTVWQNYLVVGDGDGWVFWLDLNSGDFVAKEQMNNSGIIARPLVVNDNVIIQTRNGKIYALSK